MADVLSEQPDNPEQPDKSEQPDNSEQPDKPEQPDTPGPLRRLGDALWGGDEDDISHDECRALLPQFVEAEVAGEDAAGLYPRVQRHLDHCDECGEEYAMLVDLDLAEQAGALNVTAESTPPVFLYHQARSPDLEAVVTAWARKLVAILAPENARDVDTAANAFFSSLKPRQASETRAAYGAALGLGTPKANPAFTTLAASFATTEDLVAQVSREQFDEWQAQDRATAEIETRGEATARGIGLEATAARDFGRAFAQVVREDPEKLRNLMGG